MLVEFLHQLADNPIELKNKIAVWSGLGLAAKIFARERGEMHRLGRVIQEERFLGRVADVLLDKRTALFQEDHVDLLHVEIRRDQPAAAIVRISMFW